MDGVTRYDFRSDTATKPTREMIHAMDNADLGDDEDPTVNRLQDSFAAMTGHEAALFCASGTMTNQIAIRTHLNQPPYSVLCDSEAHVYRWESSGIAFHCGASVDAVRAAGKWLTAREVADNISCDDDILVAPTRLISLENTMNGAINPISDIEEIAQLARQRSIPIHLDGARLWNSSVTTGITIADYCKHFDSASLCLSKGLGAPIGSVLVGSKPFIRKAIHFRKLFGGGWRQAGLLAAAGLVALDHIPLLHRDHEHASLIASELIALGIKITRPVETNMVWYDASEYGSDGRLVSIAAKNGVKLSSAYGAGRLVLHRDIDRKGIDLLMRSVHEFINTSSK